MQRTSLSTSRRPDQVAEVLLQVALDPDWRSRLVELSASKADHDQSRDAAEKALSALSSERDSLLEYRQELERLHAAHDQRSADLDTRAQSLTEGGYALKVRSDNLDARDTTLAGIADSLTAREGTLAAGEAALERAKRAVAEDQAAAQALIDNYTAKLANAEKLLAGA